MNGNGTHMVLQQFVQRTALAYRNFTRGLVISADVITAVGLFLVFTTGAAFGVTSGARMVGDYIHDVEGSLTLHAFVARLQGEASGANAIFVPTLDVNGQPNCNGSGWCHEIDFFRRNASYQDSVDAYVFTGGATPGVQEYRYTSVKFAGPVSASTEQPQSPVAIGAPWKLQTFSTRAVDASAFPTDPDIQPAVKALLANAGQTPKDVSLKLDFPAAPATNQAFLYRVASDSAGEDGALGLAAIAPAGLTLDVGYYAPSPPPSLSFVGSSSLVFYAPTAPVQSTQVSEPNYHDWFAIPTGQNCAMGATTVAAFQPPYPYSGAQYSGPNANNPPPPPSDGEPYTYPNPNDGSNQNAPAIFAVTPQNPGLCTAQIRNVYANTPRGTLSIDVMGPLAVAPGSMSFYAPWAPAQAGAATKTYDNQSIGLSFSGCSGLAGGGQGSQSPPSSPGTTPSTTAFGIQPTSSSNGGSCTMTVSDQYGETGQIQVSISVPPLTVSPNPMTFTSSQSPSQTLTVSQQGYPGNFSFPTECIVGSGQSVPAGTVAATVSGSTAGPTALLTVTPNGSMTNIGIVSCILAISGGGGQTVMETVYVDPYPTSAPLWVVSYTQTNGSTKVEYSTGNPGPCCGSNGTSNITWTLQASNGQTVPNCTFTASGVDTNPSGNAISSYQASGCPSGYTYAWFAPSPATMVYVSLGIWDSYDTTQLYNVAGGLMTPIPNCNYVLEMNWQPWDPLKYRTLNSAQITSPNYGGCPASYNTFPGYY